MIRAVRRSSRGTTRLRQAAIAVCGLLLTPAGGSPGMFAQWLQIGEIQKCTVTEILA